MTSIMTSTTTSSWSYLDPLTKGYLHWWSFKIITFCLFWMFNFMWRWMMLSLRWLQKSLLFIIFEMDVLLLMLLVFFDFRYFSDIFLIEICDFHLIEEIFYFSIFVRFLILMKMVMLEEVEVIGAPYHIPLGLLPVSAASSLTFI